MCYTVEAKSMTINAWERMATSIALKGNKHNKEDVKWVYCDRCIQGEYRSIEDQRTHNLSKDLQAPTDTCQDTARNLRYS